MSKAVRNKASVLIGYCRVSTEEQAQEGISLDAQKEKIEQYSNLYGYKLLDVFVDAGLSGKSLDRPALQKALSWIKNRKANGILVSKLDRLTRRVYDLAYLIDAYFKGDAHLLSVNEQLDTHSPAGRLLVHILASVAEWERETIAERVRDALSHLKSKGVMLGRTPLGKERIKEIDSEGRKIVLIVPSEEKIVDFIYSLRKQGKSLREIASILQLEGCKTKHGGKWQAQTIANVLKRL